MSDNAGGTRNQSGNNINLGHVAEKDVISRRSKAGGNKGGDTRFGGIKQNGEQGQVFASGAQNIGGADVAGADFADVAVAGHAGQNQAEGNGAEQIAAEGTEE